MTTGGTNPTGPVPAAFDTAIAYCRLAAELAAGDASSKPAKEAWCLSQILSEALQTGVFTDQPVNVVDLGCGNGEKGLQILRVLNDRDVRPVHYVPIDLSPYCGLFAILTVLRADGRIALNEADDLLGAKPTQRLLDELNRPALPYETLIAEICKSPPGAVAIRRSNVVVPSRGVVVDFMRDAGRLRELLARYPIHRDGSNIFLVLGQTLGNYEPEARSKLLRHLHGQMIQGDLLLIDGGLRPEEATQRDDNLAVRIDNLEAFYRTGVRFMRPQSDWRDSRYCVFYDRASHRIAYWFERPDGTRQEFGFSTMWTIKGFFRELHSAGFEIEFSASSLERAGFRSGPEAVAVLARRGADR